MNIQAFDKSSTVIQNTKDQMSGGSQLNSYSTRTPSLSWMSRKTWRRNCGPSHRKPESLCTLRYSATHKDYFNLVYRLDPVKAYDLRLVKRIEVDSVVAWRDFNQPYIAVKTITATKTRIAAKLRSMSRARKRSNARS